MVKLKKFKIIVVMGILIGGSGSSFAQGKSEIINNNIDKIVPEKSVETRNLEKNQRAKVEEQQIAGINAAMYQQGYPTGEAFNPINYIIDRHFTKYCSALAPAEQGKFPCQEDLVLQHGDIKVSGLLTPLSFSNANQQEVATLFVNSLIFPYPNTYRTNEELITALKESKSRETLAKELLNQGLLSIARHPFAEIIADRTATGGGNGTKIEIIQREANKRFMNPDWNAYLNDLKKIPINKTPASDNSAILAQIAEMLAYQNWMTAREDRHMEEIKVLLAGILVQLNRSARESAGLAARAESTGAPPPPAAVERK